MDFPAQGNDEYIRCFRRELPLFDQITLSNGLRLIGERLDHVRSVSVGLWLGAGSQYEIPPEAGVSHFLEHMAFKGTQKRTARQIAEEMDAVGGQLNAFTSKECTCFYAKVVDEDLPLAIDVLADLVTAPKFDPVELEKEKGVVLEEIAMAEDAPEDVVHELIMLAHFGDQPVARPILGNEERVSAFTPRRPLRLLAPHVRPQGRGAGHRRALRLGTGGGAGGKAPAFLERGRALCARHADPRRAPRAPFAGEGRGADEPLPRLSRHRHRGKAQL